MALVTVQRSPSIVSSPQGTNSVSTPRKYSNHLS